MSTSGDIEVKDAPVEDRASRESTVSAPIEQTPTPGPAPIQNEKSQNQELQQQDQIPQISVPQPKSNTQSPQIKSEEISSRNTPVPQVLQFQVPNDQKVSDIVGGAPVRQWLNEHVTPTLLQGVRKISTERYVIE
ncbi:Mediator of RNA polymerase II transcription subunit 13 [Wickerhamomyces ciferrii]|uniref:Mediator of RNA polymerase II transcription subunit 13 n=1 Tax=Wickerhamomyces ciferrii (strain ATCC 14091 / BCRC 22168 / CBS 111 / JCM 3599 / NBRC 0793 / NRRL Y-1031 F-60-10) TaxID=1206466 RepID=K0KLV5_WICCF|nr:Mediator of RNA polymerase II transcription subunit 13 [Wickerhamomyces ciferrii]CCH43976.1 Mediator of RNA polymerase II transcription subunit 13 [Wickerhamomyces ciferrii]